MCCGTSPLEREFVVLEREARLRASEWVGWDLMHSGVGSGVSKVRRGQAEGWVQRQVGRGLGYSGEAAVLWRLLYLLSDIRSKPAS